MSNREASDEVKRHRREALDAGLDEYLAAAVAKDEKTANRALDELKALKLLVPDEKRRPPNGPGRGGLG